MTLLSYELPASAPQKMVWFAQCDVCKQATLGPWGNSPTQKAAQKAEIVMAGWRYQQSHPMDTCRGCQIGDTNEQ